MKIELNEKDIKKIMPGNVLAEILAEKIAAEKYGGWQGEFKDEVIKGLDQAVKEIIEMYLKEFEAEDKIRQSLAKTAREIGKQEILKIILERMI